MALEYNIEGLNVLITGGASGLGAAYAEAILKFGAKNVAILDVAEDVGKETTRKLNESYENNVTFLKCDVSKEEDIENAFRVALNAFKRIDVIINNAGIMNDAVDVWRTATDINFRGLVSLTERGIRHMRKDKGGAGGTIINISSTAAFGSMGFLPVYSAIKAAVLYFSRIISTPEFNNETGIRILTMCPGATDTPLMTNIENKSFEYKMPQEWIDLLSTYQAQKVESVVTAVLKMFREGAGGSVWLSIFNKPAKDITSIIEKSYEPLLKLITPEE